MGKQEAKMCMKIDKHASRKPEAKHQYGRDGRWRCGACHATDARNRSRQKRAVRKAFIAAIRKWEKENPEKYRASKRRRKAKQDRKKRKMLERVLELCYCAICGGKRALLVRGAGKLSETRMGDIKKLPSRGVVLCRNCAYEHPGVGRADEPTPSAAPGPLSLPDDGVRVGQSVGPYGPQRPARGSALASRKARGVRLYSASSRRPPLCTCNGRGKPANQIFMLALVNLARCVAIYCAEKLA